MASFIMGLICIQFAAWILLSYFNSLGVLNYPRKAKKNPPKQEKVCFLLPIDVYISILSLMNLAGIYCMLENIKTVIANGHHGDAYPCLFLSRTK